jgi:hypothetical protein
MRAAIRNRTKLLLALAALVAAGAAAFLIRTGGARSQAGSGETAVQDEEHRRYLAERARYEREADSRIWIAGIQSRCDGSDGGARPQVCVRLLAADPLAKSQIVRVAVSWRNLPAEAGLVVHLLRDVPPGRRAYLAGATGPLMLAPLPVAGTGSQVIEWTVGRAGCAPADGPMWCPTEIGRYRLLATVYDRAGFAILGWPDPNPPRAIAQSGSPGFRIGGEPDWRGLEHAFAAKARHQIADGRRVPHNARPRPLGGMERSADSYCMRFAPAPPLAGEIRVCAPGTILREDGLWLDPHDLTASGSVHLAAGVIDPAQAEARARALAARPYLGRVRFRHQPSDRESGFPGGDFQAWSDAHPHATTYLSEDVGELRYRAEDGGYWLFVISEIMAGGKDGMAGRFADKVLVRVANSGEACVVETIPYRGGGFSRDLEADPIACPRR